VQNFQAGPLVHVPGFQASPYASETPVASPSQLSNGYGGYQASHKQLTEEFSWRAFVAYTVHNGEIVNVKAILAHFPRGSTKAVMIGVCLVQYPDL
jgi:hypothetical protein